MNANRKRWDLAHLAHFTQLQTDIRNAPIMKDTVEFKDPDGQFFTILTSSIRSVSQRNRSVYLNLFDNSAIEIGNDYDRARDILHNAYYPPTEYYIAGIEGQVHYIPVLQVRNLIDKGSFTSVFLIDGTEYTLPCSADAFLASKVEIKG